MGERTGCSVVTGIRSSSPAPTQLSFENRAHRELQTGVRRGGHHFTRSLSRGQGHQGQQQEEEQGRPLMFWQQIYLDSLCFCFFRAPDQELWLDSCERLEGKTVANGTAWPSPLPPLPQLWLWNKTSKEHSLASQRYQRPEFRVSKFKGKI